MMTDMIREELLRISENWDLISVLLNDIDYLGDYDYAYVVYVVTPKPLLVTARLYRTDWGVEQLSKSGKGFKEFLEAHKPRSFADTLFLLHMFPHWDFVHRGFGDQLIISDILRESRGFVLWHYQLENLFRLFYQNNDQVVKLRKAINRRENVVYELSKTLAVGKASLYEVLIERMGPIATSFPNMRGAYNLYHALFSC